MSVKHLTTANFENEVMKSDKPVLVDFWATWCGPCQMLTPVIEELGEELSDVVVAKVNVDEQGELAARYNVMSIPTLIVFKEGKVAGQQVGFVPKEVIKELISKSV